jgi:hypothetical protein
MKQIVPATGNPKIKMFDCRTEGKCQHTTTWYEVIIAYLILTDEDLPENADSERYVIPITTLDAMQHVQTYGGAHCHIVNGDGVDETEMTDIR